MKTIINVAQNSRQSFTIAEKCFLPQYAVVPYTVARQNDFECIVKVNDIVTEGQIIALKLGAPKSYIHSPVPGRVISFEDCLLTDGRMGRAVRIKLEGAFSYLGKNLPKADWQWLNAEEFLAAIVEKGVSNTFDEKTSLYRQLLECKGKKERFLVVRLFDDDPSRQTDSFVAKKYTEEVLEGALIASRAMNARGIVFALPKNAIQVPENLTTVPTLNVYVQDKKYPLGLKQSLVRCIKSAPKSEEQLLFNEVSERSVFVDPETLYSLYEAIVFGKPVLETFVHVGGPCLDTSSMLRVRIGTSLKELAMQCGGFIGKPSKAIINGVVRGTAVQDFDITITQNVKSVSFVGAHTVEKQIFGPCIRCGKCRNICPEGLLPDLMIRHSLGGKPIGYDLQATAAFCSGCALCNSVCPARLPLSQTIELMRRRGNENT